MVLLLESPMASGSTTEGGLMAYFDGTQTPPTLWVADADLRQLLIARTGSATLTGPNGPVTVQIIIDDVTAARNQYVPLVVPEPVRPQRAKGTE